MHAVVCGLIVMDKDHLLMKADLVKGVTVVYDIHGQWSVLFLIVLLTQIYNVLVGIMKKKLEYGRNMTRAKSSAG